ncbi:hypothetical protein GW915_00975 [bacterium]|nr:hypothetical protein [bacterium]
MVIPNEASSPHRYFLSDEPSSADPLDYDAFVHHTIFSSVHGNLVSQYKKSHIVGVIAQDWKTSSDFKVWEFSVRPNIVFEDGSAIDAKAIVRSMTRMAFLLRQRHSQDGTLSRLKGWNQLKNASQTFEGIHSKENKVLFKFVRPVEDFLEAVSFGQYGIVHPNMYEETSGEWKVKKRTISSSFYRLKDWTNDSLTIALRQDFLPKVRHQNPLEEVEFFWHRNQETPIHSDLLGGMENAEDLRQTHVYGGGTKSKILYARCDSWRNKTSVFHDIDSRRCLRSLFYQGLKAEGIEVTSSFFPKSIRGVTEPEKNPAQKINGHIDQKKIIATQAPESNPKTLSKDFGKSYNHALSMMANYAELDLEIVPPIQRDERQSGARTVDIEPRGTGLKIESPHRDIRFMFKSKEGIQLPDLDGQIEQELENESFDVQRVNELLWDQAIIWPIAHLGAGVWYKKDKYEFSQLNTSLPPIEFQWIGLKKE